MARSKNLTADSEFEQARAHALSLELDERATLARILLESLETLTDTEAENERLWLEEAERRQQEVREGRVQLVPGDEVKALLDRVLG